MTNEFNDPELERMLGRLGGAYPDANVAYEAVRGRVRQVKRRRAIVASTAACAMLFGVAAVAAQGTGNSGTSLSPAAGAETSISLPDTSAPAVTDSSVVDTTVADTVVDTTVADTVVDTTVVVTSVAGGGGGGDTSSSTPTSAPSTSDSSTSTSVDPTSSSVDPSTSVTLPQGEHTWTSDGGSVTIDNTNGALTLVSIDANSAAGFQEDSHARDVRSNRIRVEFTDGSTTWRIEIRTDNGKARAEITRHG